MTQTGLAVIAGVGEGLGIAIARRFARGGYKAVLVSRKPEKLEHMAAEIIEEGGQALACPVDLRDEIAVRSMFDELEAKHGPVEAAVFNAGAQHRQEFMEIEPAMVEKVWRLGCHAGFVVGQAAARHMAFRGRGTILFTGATASVRGGAEFAAFAITKAGLRALAQSMARSLGPKGIHVAHVVVDGVVDMPAIHARFPDLVAKLGDDGMLSTDAIAETYFALHNQQRSAWSFEVDVRPWSEQF